MGIPGQGDSFEMVQKELKRPRGRPRAYDPDDALVQATESFWHAGFAGTSLDALSAATGMNRPSLYGAFGDKRELYLAALDRYVEVSRADMVRALSDDVPIEAGIQGRVDRVLPPYLAQTSGPPRYILLRDTAH